MTSSLLGLRTLVLNANYMPISIFPLESIPAEDAITRVINGTCHTVFEYDRPILTPTANMNWPSVIARNNQSNPKSLKVKLRRETIFYRDHGMCAYCEKKLVLKEVTFDHVYPKVRGGPHTWENLVTACSKCNSRKGHALPQGEWKPKFTPFVPDYWDLVKARRKFPITIPNQDWTTFLGDWEADVVVENLSSG
jgi:5-methylcytosine-specific restriction endonuclease McrA